MAKLDLGALHVESFEMSPSTEHQLPPSDSSYGSLGCPISTFDAPCPTNFLC